MESIKSTVANVLVVDDEVEYCQVMAEILRKAGHTVLTANSAMEALEILAQTTPDLILLDIMMPEVNGLTLASHLRADPDWSTIPVVAVSANSQPDERIAALSAGANCFLPKPFTLTELNTVIGPFLRHKDDRSE